MKFKVCKIIDKSKNELYHNIAKVYTECDKVIKLAEAVKGNLINTKRNIENNLSIETYYNNIMIDFKYLRSTIDKIENNLNKLK